jgi:hypothetical protein
VHPWCTGRVRRAFSWPGGISNRVAGQHHLIRSPAHRKSGGIARHDNAASAITRFRRCASRTSSMIVGQPAGTQRGESSGASAVVAHAGHRGIGEPRNGRALNARNRGGNRADEHGWHPMRPRQPWQRRDPLRARGPGGVPTHGGSPRPRCSIASCTSTSTNSSRPRARRTNVRFRTMSCKRCASTWTAASFRGAVSRAYGVPAASTSFLSG